MHHFRGFGSGPRCISVSSCHPNRSGGELWKHQFSHHQMNQMIPLRAWSQLEKPLNIISNSCRSISLLLIHSKKSNRFRQHKNFKHPRSRSPEHPRQLPRQSVWYPSMPNVQRTTYHPGQNFNFPKFPSQIVLDALGKSWENSNFQNCLQIVHGFDISQVRCVGWKRFLSTGDLTLQT